MKFADLLTMHVIGPGVMLVCLALTSRAYDADTRFASGKGALAIPFELVDDHVYVRVCIDNSPPLFFLLETGAEPLDVYVSTDKVSLSLPGVVLSGQSLMVASLDTAQDCLGDAPDDKRDQDVPFGLGAKEGKPIVMDGVLGKGFFNSFVVEIDYAERLINLYDPHDYKYTGRGKSFSLEMDPHNIFVRAQVKAQGRPPVKARLIVDTGAGTALRLTMPFAEAHKLLPPTEKLSAVASCGIGGYAKEKSLVGLLEAVQLGHFELSNPVTVFYQDPAAQGYDGLLGGSALRSFKVIFDYSRSRMILEPPR
jgi:hypothetical protein